MQLLFTLRRTSFIITHNQNRLGEQYNNMWIIASWVIYIIYILKIRIRDIS